MLRIEYWTLNVWEVPGSWERSSTVVPKNVHAGHRVCSEKYSGGYNPVRDQGGRKVSVVIEAVA